MLANPEKYQALRLSRTDYEMNIECCKNMIPLSNEIKLLGVTIDNKLRFDAHIVSVCRKVGEQVNALNRIDNILLVETKEALYHAFILPNFYYCSQVWHLCGTRNTKKLERVNEHALRYVFTGKTAPYKELLQRIGI